MKLTQILDQFRTNGMAAIGIERKHGTSAHYLMLASAQAVENLEVENERLRERLLDLQKQIDELKLNKPIPSYYANTFDATEIKIEAEMKAKEMTSRLAEVFPEDTPKKKGKKNE